MTAVGRLQEILAQIRSTLASKADRGQKARGGGVTSVGQSPAARSARPTVEELKAQISGGLASADLSSPQGRREARRVFLESVLLAEFGVTLASDPRFTEIVNSVQDSFEQEPSLLTSLDSVLDELGQR